MKADYKNWIPPMMVRGLFAGTAALAAGTVCAAALTKTKTPVVRAALVGTLGLGALACSAYAGWSVHASNAFSYDGERQLSKQIVEGTAGYVHVPDGGVCLDVGCGSGALTIAAAKRNPHANVLGIDRWGKEYVIFNKALCERNAAAEDVSNVTFMQGNAVKLDFPDETFDTVTSNYVYHNIIGKNKQALLKETLRVLKKGGTFAIHDLMSKARYGDMEQFVRELQAEGYEDVQLIDTTNGLFMSPKEAKRLMLSGSTLLVGKK